MKTLKLSCGAELNVKAGGALTRVHIDVTQPHVIRGIDVHGYTLELRECTILIDPVDLEDIAIFFNDLADEFELNKKAEKGTLP